MTTTTLVISGVVSSNGESLAVPPSSCCSSFSCSSFRSNRRRRCSTSFDPKLILKSFHSCIPRERMGIGRCRRRGLTVRATGNGNDDPTPVAPLRLESPTGQLLEQILQTHPHLLPAAIDQHLENLQAERDGEKQEAPPPAKDLLYRRIAEVKEKDRKKTLEEIIYCLIVQKFMDNGISMIPCISTSSDPTGRIGFWPNQEQKLESVHSPESFEMIQSHLELVLGERTVGPLDSFIQISKIKLGKLYAASIMYGYFLKRVDQRFQLERSMNTLPKGFEEEQVIFKDPAPENQLWDPDSLIRIQPDEEFGDAGGLPESGEAKSSKLKSYVLYLDADTLQSYATIRSKESMSLIERQTQALFGRPDIRIAGDGSIDTSNDEAVEIVFSGLALLVLEAVTFGSFLWDAEGYVESRYSFVKS